MVSGFLSTRVAVLQFESGEMYMVRRDAEQGLVMAETGDDWQCFSRFQAVDDSGEMIPDTELIETAKRLVVAHKFEPSGSCERVWN